MSKSKSTQRVGDFFLQEPGEKYKSYRICWYNADKKRTDGISTGLTDREEAEAALAAHKLKHTKELLKDEPLLNACNRYFLDYGQNLPSAETIRRAIKRTMDVLGSPMCAAMDNTLQWKLINAWRAGDKGDHFQQLEGEGEITAVSDGTIDRWLGILWAAMNFAVENKHLDRAAVQKRLSRKRWKPNFGRVDSALKIEDVAKLFDAACKIDSDIPTLKLLPPKGKYKLYRIYYYDCQQDKTIRVSAETEDPIKAEYKRIELERRLIAAHTAGPRIVYGPAWRFLVIMTGSGARSEAVLDLSKTNGQIDFQHHVLDLNPPGRRQTNKYRALIAMAPSLERWLTSWEPATSGGHFVGVQGRRIARGRNLFNNLCRKSGVKATPKMFRHFVATWLASQGVPTWERDMFMGHRKPDGNATGNRYAHYEPQYLRNASDAIEKLFASVDRLMSVGSLMTDKAKEDQPAPMDERQWGWLHAFLDGGERLVGWLTPEPPPAPAPLLAIVASPEGVRLVGKEGGLGEGTAEPSCRFSFNEAPSTGRESYTTAGMVGAGGFEPPTSCLSSKRSTAELRAPDVPAAASFLEPSAALAGPTWQERGAAEIETLTNQLVARADNDHVKE